MIQSFLFSFLGALLFSLPMPGLILKDGLSPSLMAFLCSLSGIILFFSSLRKYAYPYWSLTGFLIAYYIFTFYWVTVPIEEFKGIPSPWSHVFALVFYVFNFLHYYVALYLIRYLARKNIEPFYVGLGIAFIVATFDFFYPQILGVQLGNSFSLLPGASCLLGLGGTPLLTFALIFFSWFVVGKYSLRARAFMGLTAIVVIVASSLIYGKIYNRPNTSKRLSVSLVQPNIANLQKIIAEQGNHVALRTMITALIRPSKKATGVLFWPETAIPYTLPFSQIIPGEKQHWIYRDIFGFRQELVTGAYLRDEKDLKGTNSLLVWEDGKVQVYDKGVLKPFAEEFPFPLFMPLLEKLFNLKYELKRGENQKLLTLKGLHFVGLICYEILRPLYIRNLLNKFEKEGKEVDFLLNVANDGWFGSTAQPPLHFYMNRIRALEFGKALVRVANTGVTGVIYPHSDTEVILPRLKESVLNTELQIDTTLPTPYQIWGYWVLLLLVTLLVTIQLLIKRIVLLKSKPND